MHRIYYVSSENGNDKNSGLSQREAFRSLKRINRLNLRAGDHVLLECGSVFREEYLHIYQGGTREQPIVVDSYGEGDKPVISAEGAGVWYQNYGGELDNPVHRWKGYVSSAVLLYDAEYISIRNLEITNKPVFQGERFNQGDLMARTGVSVVAKDKGTLHGIELEGLFIHDVSGNVYDKHLNNGGIYVSALKPEEEEKTGIARFEGIHIHHCHVEACRRWGIAVGYTYQHERFKTLELPDGLVKKYGATEVVIEHNLVRGIGGDGITPMYCYRPLVQYNVSEDVAKDMNPSVYTEQEGRGGMTAAAMWPWKCKGALFQYNEAYATCYNQDGQAWDADSGDGTVYQYNYSYGNGGGCIMFCEGESVNNVFRYNISKNDGTGIVTPVRNVDAHIYNNTFYIGEGIPFIRQELSGDAVMEGGAMLVENNVLFYSGKPAKKEDWHFKSPKAVYQNNLYFNYQNIPEEDTEGILAECDDSKKIGSLGKGHFGQKNIGACDSKRD